MDCRVAIKKTMKYKNKIQRFMMICIAVACMLFMIQPLAAADGSFGVNTAKTQIKSTHSGNYHSISYVSVGNYNADGTVNVTLSDYAYSTNGAYNYWTGDGLIYVDGVYTAMLSTQGRQMSYYNNGGINYGYQDTVSCSFKLSQGKTYTIQQKNRVYGNTVANGIDYTITISIPYITYTISYNGNGHSGGSTASSSHTYNTAKNLTTNGFYKTGHSFAGWATSSGGGIQYTNGQSVKNLTTVNGATITLYAKWNANTYTITYNANNGVNAPQPQSYVYGQGSISLSPNRPTRSGYIFLGWSLSQNATSPTYYPEQAWSKSNASNYILYAVWEKESVPVLTIKDGYYFKNENISIQKVLENTSAMDEKDGDLSQNIQIISLQYPSGEIVQSPTHLDTSTSGKVLVTYACENSQNNQTTQTGWVYILDKEGIEITNPSMDTVYVRFISAKYLDTLDENSIWKSEVYYEILMDSLTKTTDTYLKEYAWINEEGE